MEKNNFKKFMILWFGQFIASVGNGLTSFGLGVYVFEQTGKASSMALITLFAFLPGLLLSVFAGILADRYDRRMLMILGDGLSAIGLVYILVFMIMGKATLLHLCIGVTISSVFSALLDPAYQATVTDLLNEDQYSKASGLVQIAGAARFLVSPLLAGFLLAFSDIKLLLILDIATLVLTVFTTLVARKGISEKPIEKEKNFKKEMKEGWLAITEKRGIFILVLVSTAITFFVGFFQTLNAPIILAFSDSKMLGLTTTICASGMLVTSFLLGVFTIKKGYVKMLSAALFFAGLFMAGFAFKENIIIMCFFGFLFFAMLPPANTGLDYLIRTNVENELQGRAWGLIGFISQFGYVLAFAVSGILADYVFTPLLLEEGLLSSSVGKAIGVGAGRGTSFLLLLAGVLLSITAAILYNLKSVKKLED